MRKFLKLVLIVACNVIFLSCKSEPKNQQISTPEVTFTKEGSLELYTITDYVASKIITLDIEIADDEYQIQTGLMYRKSMQNDRGMLFIFPEDAPRSFYMKNTQFSLDIIYINSQHKVVSIQKNAIPYNERSLPSQGVAKYVLEVNGGLTDIWNIKAGDSISYKTL